MEKIYLKIVAAPAIFRLMDLDNLPENCSRACYFQVDGFR